MHQYFSLLVGLYLGHDDRESNARLDIWVWLLPLEFKLVLLEMVKDSLLLKVTLKVFLLIYFENKFPINALIDVLLQFDIEDTALGTVLLVTIDYNVLMKVH
jgi:hypothetical protein